MEGLDIVGLGLTVLDVLVRLKDMPTWEQGGRMSAFALDGGGPAGTGTVAAARLGARAGFVGTAGNDPVARIKLDSLREHGVDISRMVIRDRPETGVVLVYVHEETGERVFAGLGALGIGPLRPEELDRDYITSAEFLHLDSFHREAALQAAQWMHAAGKRVCIDCSRTDGRPCPPQTLDLLRHVDILICGSNFGLSATGQRDLWAAGEAMLALGPSIVVQTEGADGSYTVTAEERFHTPAFQVEVVDTTGAGDVFHGAYLVGLLKGWDVRTVATFATAVSALKCTKLGGRRSIPTYDQVIGFLQERGIDLT
jgi:sulfofructose kinase